MSEWLNKLWYIYTTEHYSAIKKNKILIYATNWMALQGITLSKKSQFKKVHILYDSIYITFLRWQNLKIGEKIIGCQELMSGGVGMGGKWYGYKRPTGEILQVVKSLCIYLDCVNANILAII